MDPILRMGLLEQDAPRHVYAIDHAFSCYDGDRYLVVLPYDGFRVTFTSINPHPLLGTQVLDVTDAGIRFPRKLLRQEP